MSTLNTTSDAEIRRMLRAREAERRRLSNQIILQRREGAGVEAQNATREAIARNRVEGRALSLDNTNRRRTAQTAAEVQPRTIPPEEMARLVAQSRARGQAAEGLRDAQRTETRSLDAEALADVQLQTRARQAGFTPQQQLAIERLRRPVTPDALAQQADQVTAQTLRAGGRPVPQDLQNPTERVAAAQSRLDSTPTPTISGVPTDPELRRQFIAGRTAFDRGQREIEGQATALETADIRREDVVNEEIRRLAQARRAAEERARISIAQQAGQPELDDPAAGLDQELQREAVAFERAARAVGAASGEEFQGRVEKIVDVIRMDAGASGVFLGAGEAVTSNRAESEALLNQIDAMPPETRDAIYSRLRFQLEQVGITSSNDIPNVSGAAITHRIVARIFGENTQRPAPPPPQPRR